MGFPKALLPLAARGEIFLTAILKKLDQLEFCAPIVILGRHAEIIRPAISKDCCRILINPDPDMGQLSSMKLAIEHISHSCAGCLFWPVDQPLVSADLVKALVRLFLDSRAPIVLPRFGSKRGHPAIFSRSIFKELLSLPLEGGPKILVHKYQKQIAVLQTEERAVIEDIDTPEDYQKIIIDRLNDC
jgi:molybdenum cofactor cytidylyltransferase